MMLRAMKAMMAQGGVRARYENVDMLRETELPDAEKFIDELEPYVTADAGYAVDLGAGCGFIAGEYALAWPHLTVIATEVSWPVEVDPEQFWAMPLLRRSLKRLSEDHASKAEKHRNKRGKRKLKVEPTEEKEDTVRAELYNRMLSQAVEVDVLQAEWHNVAELKGQCRLVTCTMLMHQKGFETPEMWRMVVVGAAKLLAEGGCLFMFDTGKCGGFGSRDVVAGFARRVGLAIHLHEKREDGVDGRGLYAVVLQKPTSTTVAAFSTAAPAAVAAAAGDTAASDAAGAASADGSVPPPLPPRVLEEGDVVEVHSLNGRRDLNGMTAVLGAFRADKNRWECRISAGVTAKRVVEEVLVQRQNLRQLMP